MENESMTLMCMSAEAETRQEISDRGDLLLYAGRHRMVN